MVVRCVPHCKSSTKPAATGPNTGAAADPPPPSHFISSPLPLSAARLRWDDVRTSPSFFASSPRSFVYRKGDGTELSGETYFVHGEKNDCAANVVCQASTCLRSAAPQTPLAYLFQHVLCSILEPCLAGCVLGSMPGARRPLLIRVGRHTHHLITFRPSRWRPPPCQSMFAGINFVVLFIDSIINCQPYYWAYALLCFIPYAVRSTGPHHHPHPPQPPQAAAFLHAARLT